MFLLHYPILLYPNGNEAIFSDETVIIWDHSSKNELPIFSYEIYFTEKYDDNKEPDWQQLAVVPGTATRYVWKHGIKIQSDKCRIAIRSRAANGERSPFSISANNFSVNRRRLIAPVLISPVTNGKYDEGVSILTNDLAIEGNGSSKGFYQFSYSSEKLGIPKTTIYQDIAPGENLFWNTLELDNSDDYIFYASLSDDNGNTSEETILKNIVIKHEGYFIIDTVPPVGSIIINDYDVFTKTNEVSVKIAVFDRATGVHSIALSEDDEFSLDLPAKTKMFSLSADDGVKTVELLAQDFAGNRIGGELQKQFEVLASDNSEIIDQTTDSNGFCWFITSGETNSLYKTKEFASLILTLEENPTTIEFFSDFIYITTISGNKGKVFQYSGFEIENIKTLSENDSIINSSIVYKKKLYLGAENGIIYEFDGLTFKTIYGPGGPIQNLVTDGNILYLVEKNSNDIYVFNGSAFLET